MGNRNLFLAALIMIITVQATAQEAKSDTDLFFNIGLKYVPIDWISGPLLGLSIDKASSKFAYNLRHDILLKIGRSSQSSTSGFVLTSFGTLSYFDIDFKLTEADRLVTGVGWIYGRNGENTKFNQENGYAVITLGYKRRVSWINIEIRGDIPIQNQTQEILLQHTYPISFALIYKFSPKNST